VRYQEQIWTDQTQNLLLIAIGAIRPAKETILEAMLKCMDFSIS